MAGIIVAAAIIMLLSTADAPAPIGRGSAAPDFSLPQLEAPSAVTLSDLRGQVVLVNFWATWCKPCEDEMPAMERLYQQLRPEGFELLAISVGEESSVVEEFCERLGITFPVLLDAEKSVAGEWQTFAFPESLLVGRNGQVLERYVGPRDWDAPAYVARIRRLLEAAPAGS